MSTPIGHTLVGIALAKRLGVHSNGKLALCAALANAPDLDIAVGIAFFGEPWRVHRGTMHNIGLVALAGAVAGWVGLAAPDRHESRLRMALVGATVSGSHVVLDRLPFQPMSKRRWVPRALKRRFAGMSIANWLLDVATGSIISLLLLANGRRLVAASEGWRAHDNA